MGIEQSSGKLQQPASLSVTTPWLRLSNQRLLEIYDNVISVSRDLTTTVCVGATKCQYLDELLFKQCFALDDARSSELFKAFDRNEDGAIEWRHCLAGLTLTADASVQQKCILILSIFDLNQRATITAAEFCHVVFTSLFAAYRICQVICELPNEIHPNFGAIAQDVLHEVMQASEKQNGSIPVSNLATLMEHSRTLQNTLIGLGVHGSPANSTLNQSMQSNPQKSPRLSTSPTPVIGGSNAIQYTYAWGSAFPNRPSMPGVRSRHAACHIGNQIYIHGGRNGNLTLKDFWKYDLVNNIWTQLNCGGDTPPSLQEHTMVAFNGRLYLFGGEIGYRDANEIALWIYDLAARSWYKQEIRSEVKTPCGRRGHTAVICNDAMHIYGGYVDLKGSVREFWSLDFETCWWHLNPDNQYDESPSARHLHSAVAYNNAMWVYGGINNLHRLKDLWKWDFCSRCWSRMKFWSGPPPLYGHSAVISHNAMLVFGGQDAEGVIKNNLWKYHFGSQSWQKIVSQKGVIPPPSTRHVMLSVIATDSLDSSTILEDPRPRSAPHLSRECRVTPLLQLGEPNQTVEIRPHSSPPFVTESDLCSKTQHKPFRNRIHPSPTINMDSEEDNSAILETSLISTAKEVQSSAIMNAMQHKKLFIPSKLNFSHSKNLQIDNNKIPLLQQDDSQDEEVNCNNHAPDVLILEDVSDQSSQDSVLDEGDYQHFVQECQPSDKQYNTPVCLPSINNLTKLSLDPVVALKPDHLNNRIFNKKETKITENFPHRADQSYQQITTIQVESAMTSLSNNLDKANNSRYFSSGIPDKTLNNNSYLQNLTMCQYRSELLHINKCEQTTEKTPSMQPQESSDILQQFSATNKKYITDQTVHNMQGQQCQQHKDVTVDMQRLQESRSEQTMSAEDQKRQQRKPEKPDEQTTDEYYTTLSLKHQGNNQKESIYQQYSTLAIAKNNPDVKQDRNDGATRPKPALHGQSKTLKSLPSGQKSTAALHLNRQQHSYLPVPACNAKEHCATNLSVCLILLGGQQTTTSSLQSTHNPICLWKCRIIPGKPTKKQVQQLISVIL